MERQKIGSCVSFLKNKEFDILDFYSNEMQQPKKFSMWLTIFVEHLPIKMQ